MEYIHERTIETTKTCLQLALRMVNLEQHRRASNQGNSFKTPQAKKPEEAPR